MPSQRVVIIGAGIAGLVSAALLAARGIEVIVLERAAKPGGKVREVEIDGRAVDSGPTVFTMRWVFDDLFAALGTSLDRHLELRQASVLARHGWGDGAVLDLYADRQRSVDAIGAFAGAADARGYVAFCDEAARVYRMLEEPFIRAARPNPAELALRIGINGVADLMKAQPFRSLWSELGRYFRDPRLGQLFGRYATYCGGSPFAAPGTLMLVAHVEQAGVWMVEGGMSRIADALEAIARQKGAMFRYGVDVASMLVDNRRVVGVRLADGEEIRADCLVCNGDLGAISSGRFGPAVGKAVDAIPRHARSQSAITWSLVAKTRGFPLSRHTVFFSDDYAAEFEAVFRHGRPPANPTVYVCAQDRDDIGNPSTDGAERLLCLINAPANGDVHAYEAKEIAQCEEFTFAQLQRCGLTVERRSELSRVTTPQDFDRLFPGTGGALYGRAPHGWAASFQRPGSRSRIPGLYLAGGSVHPGPGVPMAALSGRQAALALLSDLASTRTSRLVAMPGGTSTA